MDILTGKYWYRNPGQVNGTWARSLIGAPLEDTAAVYDFDGDGDLDVFGTTGPTLPTDDSHWSPFVWGRNNGGVFTILDNIDNTDLAVPANDPIQGVAVAQFHTGGPLEIAVTWDDTEKPNANPYGIQIFTVPTNPSTQTWARRKLSDLSTGEQLSAADLDDDADLDLFLGSVWLRNNHPTNSWTPFTIFDAGSSQASRHELTDIDGDGDLDAFIGYSHEPDVTRVMWYEQLNSPTASWEGHLITNLPRGDAESLDAFDMDGDGDSDVIVGEYNHSGSTDRPGSLFIYENLGQGANWATHEIYDGDSHYQASQAADIDGDGDQDIISKNWWHFRVLIYERVGCGGPPNGTATPTATPSRTPTATATPGPSPTPTPTSNTHSGDGHVYYISSTSAGKVGGVKFADEDVLQYDDDAGEWSLFFDGSDVGLSQNDVDAFHMRADGSLLLSLVNAATLVDVGPVDDSDLLIFAPTTLGANTAGTFALFFDGSDVGLTTSAEDIDGIMELPDGRVVITTLGKAVVPGLTAQDEDALAFTPSGLGGDTAGGWSLFFQGADIGLSATTEDVRGMVMGAGNQFYLTSGGAFEIGDLSGRPTDVIRCHLIAGGADTSCSAAPTVHWSGGQNGLGNKVIDGLWMMLATDGGS